ncbi:MAG: hypothetical protein ACRD1Q_16865 [Vicinamibacterales bacterium]
MLNARNRVKRGLAIVGITFVSAIALAWALWPPFHTSFRTRLMTALEDHFKTDVELKTLTSHSTLTIETDKRRQIPLVFQIDRVRLRRLSRRGASKMSSDWPSRPGRHR